MYSVKTTDGKTHRAMDIVDAMAIAQTAILFLGLGAVIVVGRV